MNLDTLREPTPPVSTWLERVLPHSAPAVQAVFYYSHATGGGVQLVFSTPGQRSSNVNRFRVLGTMPHVSESAYTRMWSMDFRAQFTAGAGFDERPV